MPNTNSLSLVAASSQYAKTTSALSQTDGVTALTVMAWVNFTSRSLDSNQISSQWNGTNDDNKFIWRIDASSTSEMKIFIASGLSDASNFGITSGLGLGDGSWMHLAFVYDGSLSAANRLKFYKDGSAITVNITGTIPTSLTTQVDPTLWIGAKGGGASEFFDGLIDEYRISTTALSSAQILNIYQSSLAQSSLAYYPLNNSAADASGNNHNLTLVGSPTYSSTVPFNNYSDAISGGLLLDSI